MGQRLVKLLNGVTRIRRSRCAPEELLVLLPSCLQSSKCKQRITNDITECKRCGQCKIKDMIELCEKRGVRCMVATGGRLALSMAKSDQIKGIVAVACEKELQEGMTGVFPKPVLGVINIRPYGPCTDTDVNIEEVEEAIGWFLRE